MDNVEAENGFIPVEEPLEVSKVPRRPELEMALAGKGGRKRN